MDMSQSLMYMTEALIEAQKAFDQGDVPVGAVIVHHDSIIARNHNRVEEFQSPLYHAEYLVCKDALAHLKTRYLTDCDLYVTLEPCALCCGVLAALRIRRLYYGAYDPKGGFVDHNGHIFEHTNHKPDVYSGVMLTASQTLLSDFFKTLRE